MKWLLGFVIGAVLGAGVGCGTDPSGTGGGGSGGTTGSGGASPCDDPANGPVPESCGVWVSASLGKDTNSGTQSSPVASLTHAVELAKQQTGHVYACAETWSDPLVVPGNIGLHGGFDCDGDWAYLGEDKRSILATGADEIPLIVSDDGGGGKATITDFHIESADAVKPSGSSIGIFVRDTVPLWLYRCEVVAGNGADGLDGTPADTPAPDGPPGNPGADACSAAVSKGGPSPEANCDAGTSKGGAGGNGAPMVAEDGSAGEPSTGNPEDGAGGLGEGNSAVCTDGKSGANGGDGEHGKGALGYAMHRGRLTVDGYLGEAGEDGKGGVPGQGGGGGGATFGSAAVCGAAAPGGAAGGSGGAGGCGGKAGGGGQPGGASIAAALRNKLALFGTTLVSGNGGKGGDGVAGQDGGAGGAGGPGGVGSGSIKSGCKGGLGGSGGRGGWGGGGQGGASLGVAFSGIQDKVWQIASEDGSTLSNSAPGYPGDGDPMSPDSRGWPGTGALVAELDE